MRRFIKLYWKMVLFDKPKRKKKVKKSKRNLAKRWTTRSVLETMLIIFPEFLYTLETHRKYHALDFFQIFSILFSNFLISTVAKLRVFCQVKIFVGADCRGLNKNVIKFWKPISRVLCFALMLTAKIAKISSPRKLKLFSVMCLNAWLIMKFQK